ncbi:aromatic-ring-hydroxylating dioxygenase subunit beta [Amorphus sp. MBR-141]
MALNIRRDNQTDEASAFLFLEARLLDEARIREWHQLFAEEVHYWIPIDETRPTSESGSLVNDDALALEERVYHLLETTFAAQTPKSRTLHFVSNVQVDAEKATPEGIVVHSNQLILELRTGDFRQIGLGQQRIIGTSMTHELIRRPEGLRIAKKHVRLIDREMPQSNLTFLL